MKNIKTRPEKQWKNYLLKAGQFFESATDAYAKENWNAVGLNTVHAVISANDALTVYLAGIRSASDKHTDAAELLLRHSRDKKETAEYLKHYSWLISRKNLVEYESRLFYEKEAKDSLLRAERFLDWAKEKLTR